jgi:ParB family chromosome partitioning protein
MSNSKRKETVRALYNSNLGALPETTVEAAQDPPPTGSLTATGPVRAMGLELNRLLVDAEDLHTRLAGQDVDKLIADAARGRELHTQLTSGGTIVELEPDLVEPSFIADRISQADDPTFRDLVASIKEIGQLLPILVRPHPEKPNRYQIAYGHRRWRAVVLLGRPVRVVIKNPMSDQELVIAQGKENSERRDLSFIERALFAQNLEKANFERITISSALSLDQSEVARLIRVAHAIPTELVHAIGPAPKAGRRRWIHLSELLSQNQSREVVASLLASPEFRDAESDKRFTLTLRVLASWKTKEPVADTWFDSDDRPIVKLQVGKIKAWMIFDQRLAPDFALFVRQRLGELYDAFRSGGESGAERAESEPKSGAD